MKIKREIWKDIEGYEGSYQVSNLGRIVSLPRLIRANGIQLIKLRILKPHKVKKSACPFCGKRNSNKIRIAFDLYGVNGKNNFFAHYLVAKTFIPNPFHKPCIIHLDMDTENNYSNNLKWATHSEASLYRSRIVGKWGKSGKQNEKSKKIEQYYTNGRFKRSFHGACEASRITKIYRTGIVECLTGKQSKAGGFIWKYAKQNKVKKASKQRKKCRH